MTLSCVLPAFSLDQIRELSRQLFNIDGDLKQLNGERDLNYLIVTNGGKYVFKIANQDETLGMLECQHEVFERLAENSVFQESATTVISVNQRPVEPVTAADGRPHFCRMLSFVEGRLLSGVNPKSPELLYNLGETLAKLDSALTGYSHVALHRPLLWHMQTALKTLQRFTPQLESDQNRHLIEHFASHFKNNVTPFVATLRQGPIHNDANDNNVLVGGDDPWNLRVGSIIDFGDMVVSWIVAEPAIAAAYAMFDKAHPLDAAAHIIKGYHAKYPLTESEIAVFFDLICMRLCISVSICAYQRSLDPQNKYLAISEIPAWTLLKKLRSIPFEFAHYVFREACGLEPVPQNSAIINWLSSQLRFAAVVDVDLSADDLFVLDLSVSSPYIDNPQTSHQTQKFSTVISRAIADANCIAGIGRYAEYRLIYDDAAFVDLDGYQRCMHLGIDIFMPAGSAVYAPLESTVFSVANHPQRFDYGGTLILKHNIPLPDGPAVVFYTLYGHLAPASIAGLVAGVLIKPGEQIACLGATHENGQWPPHLHFQIITDMLDERDTFVGAGSDRYKKLWSSLCPDPNLILQIPKQVLRQHIITSAEMIATRKDKINPSLSLSYRNPVHVVRGSMQYLYDNTGRRFLDGVNNVPHVGHCHPRVVEAAIKQTKLLNTNTRYLYDSLTRYSEKLLATFPQPLTVCYLTNSGSEANDLAIRLARNFTRHHGIVTMDHAYHGNLGVLIDISPYKHDGKGGAGKPEYVQVAKLPDCYRGEYKATDPDAGRKYAEGIKPIIDSSRKQGGTAAFICESISGCGGQITLPPEYLKHAYAIARNAGAICIADEVQVGFARVGSHFWAFETQGVVPDIVTLGKPIGNGHPLAAVITTRQIADAFNNGMEYFNTFGGNPVSCVIGEAVLDVIEEDQLQANALMVGNYLLDALNDLKSKHAIVGDVRGMGLFIGVELVNDPISLNPAGKQASYITERLQQEGVLISTDGPLHNVLKIKPPMCFSRQNAATLVNHLAMILEEDFAQVEMSKIT